MATTQYDSPAQSNFINTYSPIPFGEMMQAGAMKVQQYEQGLDNLMKTYEDTANLKYIPNSKDEQYIKQVVIPHTRDIVDKYTNQDLSDPIIRRQMRMELNSGIDRQRIIDIQNSFSGYNQYRQEVSRLKQKGLLSPLEGTPHEGWDTSTQGTFNRLPDEWSDPIKGLQDRYFKELKGQIMRDSHGRPIADPRGYYTSAITANRIGQETEVNLNNALSTPDGQRAVALYRHQFNIPETVSDRDVLRQAMLSAGHGMIRDELAGGQYEKWMVEDEDKKNKPSYLPTPGRIAMTDVQSTKFNPSDFDRKEPKAGVKYEMTPGSVAESRGFISTRGFEPQHKGVPDYDLSLLNKPEIQTIISMLPQEYKTYNSIIQKGEKGQDNNVFEGAKHILFDKLKHIYQDVQQNMKEGAYVQRYNEPLSKQVTNQLFKTNDASKLGAGELPNLKFYVVGDDINKKGYYPTGKEFYDEFVTELVKQNKNKGLNSEISAVGDLSPENPISHPSITNDPDFINGIVFTMGGKTVIASSPSTSYRDIGAHKTYWSLRAVPNTEIEENIGGIKVKEKYQIDPKTKEENYVFAIGDPSTGKQQVVQSPLFNEVYNTVYDYLNPNK